ncbi:MAG: hypothetical protein NVSMB25_20080 [Thermoleophilaceae bacterium]
MSEDQDEGIRERLSRQGEEALGRLAEELVGNPIVNAAVARAFEAREKAVQAQEAAMGALGIPSAADIERLTRRLRSVSQRLEGIEDSVDGLDARLEGLDARLGGLDSRLESLDGRLGRIERGVGDLDKQLVRSSGARKQSKGAKQPKGDGGTGEVGERLDQIGRDLAALRQAVAPGEEPPPRAQERLSVSDG